MQLYSSKLLNYCLWLCVVWCTACNELFPSPVLSTCSLYSWRYVCFASQKSGRSLIGLCFPYSKNNVPLLLPSSPFKCSFIGMIFQCKCLGLSDLFFCPSMFRQIRAIFCVLQPPFKNSLAITILCIFGFSQHITGFGIHCLTQWLTMPSTAGIGSSSSRIQESTIRQICLCWIVDSFPQAVCIFRMCSIRHQFPNTRRNLDTVSSKKSRRTRRSRHCPNPLILDWNGWSPPTSQSLSATYSCLCDVSNCSINRPTVSLRFVSTCSTVECGMPGIRKSTRLLLQASVCLCSSLSQSRDFLESVRLCCEFGTSVTHLAAWVTDVPCSIILHQFSCMPLSLRKSMAVCLKE